MIYNDAQTKGGDFMVGEVCAYIHNFFEDDPVTGQRRIFQGRYTITGGAIVFPGLSQGQYFRVFGSEHNDGVHQYGVDQLTDEVFTGVVWKMCPTKEFLELVAEIEAWQAEYGAAAHEAQHHGARRLCRQEYQPSF